MRPGDLVELRGRRASAWRKMPPGKVSPGDRATIRRNTCKPLRRKTCKGDTCCEGEQAGLENSRRSGTRGPAPLGKCRRARGRGRWPVVNYSPRAREADPGRRRGGSIAGDRHDEHREGPRHHDRRRRTIQATPGHPLFDCSPIAAKVTIEWRPAPAGVHQRRGLSLADSCSIAAMAPIAPPAPKSLLDAARAVTAAGDASHHLCPPAVPASAVPLSGGPWPRWCWQPRGGSTSWAVLGRRAAARRPRTLRSPPRR